MSEAALGSVVGIWALLLIAALILVIFPQRKLPLINSRHRAVLTLIVVFWAVVPASVAADGKSTAAEVGPIATISLVWVLITVGVYAFIRGRVLRGRRAKREQQSRQVEENSYLDEVERFREKLAGEYPYLLLNEDGEAFLCMDGQGTVLRFVESAPAGGGMEVAKDLTVKIADVVSVDLVKHERIYVETTTTTRKKNAIGRAVVGEVLFGGVGAVVGSTSAGSVSSTVGAQRAIYESSELIFGLADLSNPVVRFANRDHAQSEIWLHRVRSAKAGLLGASVA